MAKRVHQIAKEIGVDSKVIIEKCHKEGISETVIKNHMSSVSAGLELSIKEWFSTESHGTAVETAEKVDVEQVRTRPRRAKSATKKDAESDSIQPPEVESSVAVAEPPVEAPPPPPARVVQPSIPAPVRPSRVEPVIPPPPPEEEESVKETPKVEEPPRAVASEKAPPAPPAPPPTMNKPTRPQVVKPAGEKLQQAPVKLAGPKLVRIEAAETVSPARPPRRPGAGDGGVDSRSPRGGAGVAAGGAGSSEDDRGRSPRRGVNKRRVSSGTGVPPRRRGLSNELPPGSGAWSEQDLAEREARLARAGGLLKKRRQDIKRTEGLSTERSLSPAQTGGVVKIAAPFAIKDLSAATGVKAADIVKKLFMQGVMATINSPIDPEKAAEIMIDYNIELQVTEARTAEEVLTTEFGEREVRDERRRGPVVTILGHVDHGKTSLLDRIRNANVAAGEAGGITQKTSAFRVPVKVAEEDKEVVFLDTPGHKAFTEMRARGATLTDVVVLVVSAPEGVMPQTIESIAHARAAGVPIVVALNKTDRPDATESQIQRTLKDLGNAGLNPVEWGGDVEVVRTSATNGTGITELLEVLDYQAQLLDLKADFAGPARGTVIEAKTEEGRGAVANILIQDGELKVGDFIVVGRGYGRVRDISDDRGNRLKSALPPMPVQISGIDQLPDAGDKFYVVDSLRKAQDAAEQRRDRERQIQLAQPRVTLDSIFSQIAEADVKEIRVVLKADVQGSVDVLKNEIESVKTEEVKCRVLHAAVGGITESDVLLADASKAVVIGFNVIPSGKARQLAEQKGVEIRTYQVIYDITDDLKKAAEGLLAPELRQEILGHAEVRRVFKVSKVGAIAGCYVTDGTVQRDAFIRVTRGDVVIENDRRLEQLKRFKDDAKEVRAGMECGMKIAGYDDIKEGDILECYKNVEVKRTL